MNADEHRLEKQRDEKSAVSGADASLPIALSGNGVPARVGVFRREAEKVTTIPASGVPLRTAEGNAVNEPTGASELAIGSVRLSVFGVGDDAFVAARKELEFLSKLDSRLPVQQEANALISTL